MLMHHRPSPTSRSRSFYPAEYGCAVSRHNLPMSSERSNMLRPDNVFLAVKPVDMRRGIDTLTQYIQDELKSTWHEGAAFVFINKPVRVSKFCAGISTGCGCVPAVCIKAASAGHVQMTLPCTSLPTSLTGLSPVLTGSRLKDTT
ncbi:hypothetical protein EWP97_25240 [Salmonella enterica]|nr:hypothetical protein [Salmonella enterica]